MNENNLIFTSESKKLQDFVEGEKEILYQFSSVFPFDFFPTEVGIEKIKLDITENIFFGSKVTRSILINEISKIEVSSTLFFATMKIYSKIPNQAPIVIRYLWPDHAHKGRIIIEGLIIAMTQDIEYRHIPLNELLPLLETLGAKK